ncbi:hypothetical protein B0H16DRAFT_1553494 [Mycena metata]|uniref:Uncharacterized protein n=1 Tax=Mycena metata TaxID=1033252 RepID=A0AAD7IQD3_9AGAR|nr:hypothetical protein B0H16DRAFT_1553494 [Mycena metata]
MPDLSFFDLFHLLILAARSFALPIRPCGSARSRHARRPALARSRAALFLRLGPVGTSSSFGGSDWGGRASIARTAAGERRTAGGGSARLLDSRSRMQGARATPASPFV